MQRIEKRLSELQMLGVASNRHSFFGNSDSSEQEHEQQDEHEELEELDELDELDEFDDVGSKQLKADALDTVPEALLRFACASLCLC